MLSRFKLPAAVAVLALTLGGAGTASAAPTVDQRVQVAATEECKGYKLPAGPNLHKKTGFTSEFVGLIKLKGECAICPDNGLQGPDGPWGTGPFSWIKDATARKRVTFIANGWTNDLHDGNGKLVRLGALKSNRTAAAQKSAINWLTSPLWRSDWAFYKTRLNQIDPGVVPLVDEMLNKSNAAGDVSLKYRFTDTPVAGGTGVVTATVTGNGKPLPGQPIRWKVAGAKTLAASALTNAEGKATLRLAWDGAGPLAVTPTVASPEWRKGRFSTPSAGRQHLVSGTFKVLTSGHLRYDKALRASVTQDCTTTCDGRPPVTLAAEGGGAATTWQALIAGRVAKAITVPAGGKASALIPGAKDGDVITIRYRTGKGGWRSAGKPFTVVCPPWPTVTLDCACDGALTVTLTPPAGRRYYTATVGSTTKPLTGRTTLTAPLKTGEAAAISVMAYADAGHKKPLGTHLYGTWSQGR